MDPYGTKGRMVPRRPVLRSIPGLCGDPMQPGVLLFCFSIMYLIDQWEFQDPKMEVPICFRPFLRAM